MFEQLITPREMSMRIARQAQEKRLSLNWTQSTLSKRSGVSYGALKKFERTGKISLESLLKIAAVLGCLTPFSELFSMNDLTQFKSLDQLLKTQTRKRGRE